MQQLPEGTFLAYVDTDPLQGYPHIYTPVLTHEWQKEPEQVQRAVLALVEDFDAAECSQCGTTIGAYLTVVDDYDRPAFTEALLVIDADDTVTRYCYECGVEQGYMSEDD